MIDQAIQAKAATTVLVVDDDATCRQAVVAKLKGFSVNVVEAGNGHEAFALLMRQPCDLAIIDLEMPGMNGYDLLGCIRGHDRVRHMPVIVLTSHLDIGSIERALIWGATSFLSKPLNWSAFGAHIEHIIALVSGAKVRAPTAPAATPADSPRQLETAAS